MPSNQDAELSRFQVFCWQAAVENRLELVTPQVMAVALFTSGPNSATKVIQVMDTDTAAIQQDLSDHLESTYPKRRPKVVEMSSVSLSIGSKEVMKVAADVCELMGDPVVGSHHVLMALIKTNKALSIIFAKHGISLTAFRATVGKCLSVDPSSVSHEKTTNAKVSGGVRVVNPSNPTEAKSSEPENLAKYCRNLTIMASQDKLDPVIGREKEIDRLITTLGRRKKNNAVLVGDPGVGKTAVVEGLAQRIASGKVPRGIQGCQVFQLNMTAMVGKTTYRGQFEERMRWLMDLFAANKNYILFVDEMHTIIGAGGSIGGLDAANIMKPALAGGDVRCIGATTEDEYRRFVKKDGALDRRFQRIFINEPSKAETIQILMGIKHVIEKHHHCIIPDESVKAAVDLSIRHVPDRRLPDKAIDCLDEACSNAASRHSDEKTAVVITKADVVGAIASQTDMPTDIVGVSDVNRAKKLSTFLKSKVVGQDLAIDCISTALLGAYAGIKNPDSPIGCLVLGGPSGSGTTFMAEKMAEGLFDSESSFIRINMAEFSEKFGNTRLIGSPPGYVGYGDKNQLTDKVSRRPYCLVLLDGIDGANEDVVRLFMQAMSKGVITDATGHDVSFRNAVIVMTMEFKPSVKTSSLGFGASRGKKESEAVDSLISECRKRFGDDFVNRVDEFVVFNELTERDMRGIARIRMDRLAERMKCVGVDLSYDDEVLSRIVSKSLNNDGTSNIKDVDRYIRKEIESLVSTVLTNDGETSQKLCLSVEDGLVRCEACDLAVQT